MYRRSRVLFIHPPVLNQLKLKNIILTKLNENCSIHTWNEEDDSFDNQLEKWGMGKLFSDHSEPIKRELRSYIEDWEILAMKKCDQRYCTRT